MVTYTKPQERKKEESEQAYKHTVNAAIRGWSASSTARLSLILFPILLHFFLFFFF